MIELPPQAALIERDAELRAIGEHLAAARAGADPAPLAIVSGEAGIGKTALLASARELAGHHGLQVLSGAELERDFTFGVVRQLLERLMAEEETSRERLRTGAAALAGPLFPSLADAGEPAPDPDFATLHGLYWLVATASTQQPLAILIDDLHWCDVPSLRFLQFVLRRAEGMALTVLASVRTGEPAARTPTLDGVLDEPRARVLRPQPLSRGGVAELIDRRLGEGRGAGLAEAYLETTGGNPLYTVALLEQLGADLSESLATGPDVVARSVGQRLERLGPDATALAEAVAVLGDQTELRHAAELAGLDLPRAEAAAGALERAALLRHGPRPAIAHPVVGAVVRDRIPAPRDRHGGAARILARAGAPDDVIAAQLLRSDPGAVPEGGEILLRAADTARRRGAPEIAAECLSRALSEPLSERERVGALLALGEVEIRCGRPTALAHLEQARSEATGDAERLQATLLLSRLLYVMGRPEAGVGVLEEEAARAVAPDVAEAIDSELLSLAALDLSVRPLVRERIARLSAQPLPGGRPAGSYAAQRAVAALMDGDDAAEAAALAETALASGELQARALTGDHLCFIATFVLIAADRFAAADRWSADMAATARAAGSAGAFAAAETQRAFLHLTRGDLAAAEASAHSAVEIARLNGWPTLAQLALTPLAYALVERGGHADLTATARSAGIDLEALHGGTQDTVLLEARGRLRLAEARPEAAVADLLAAGAQFTAWGVRNPSPFPWRSNAADGLALLGRGEEAAALVAEELALSQRWGAPRAIGVALRAQGRLASGAEQLALLDAARETLESSGARLELAHALTDLGAALRRANRRADARDHLRRGLELALACGAAPLAQRAHTELWATGTRPRTPLRTGVDALTPSELRVAELAVSGRSNAEIAQHLFITVKTVEMHLTRTYRKLDISRRAQLTAALEAR